MVCNQSSELAKDVSGAEALLEQHQKHKGENESRTSSFMLTAETGNRLLNEDIEEADEFRQCLQKNETLDSEDFVCEMRSVQALK
ncbi:hypothetical protein niasHS_009038 [Heterodera schachtii]|uniref:Uncharacterized protein n=1 Tax=Heterodera schachtii TaxID=97005 RepID=A0ABD2J341_HETSC